MVILWLPLASLFYLLFFPSFFHLGFLAPAARSRPQKTKIEKGREKGKDRWKNEGWNGCGEIILNVLCLVIYLAYPRLPANDKHEIK